MREISGKYTVTPGGQIANIATGEIIPADEPLFLLRGRDMLAVEALVKYETTCRLRCTPVAHQAAIHLAIADFLQFRAQHPELLKMPDTETADRARLLAAERTSLDLV